VIHRLIAQWEKKVEISRLCRLFQVSRSGFYAARARRTRPARVCPQSLHLKAAFAASGECYGSRRLCAALQAQGVRIGRYRARSLMKAQGLRACWRRKFLHTTDSRHALPVADNVLNRQFSPTAPNRAWVADITYVRTRRGWLYLAAVLDLFSRRVVGWAMAPTMPAQLVCRALSMALTLRAPTTGLLVHSDRGSQYASTDHQALLAAHQAVGSMSRKGNCWDNAVMERFFLNLKMERVWRRDYANPLEAQADISDYLVNFYNTKRLHSTLNYRSPADYEREMAVATP